MQPPIIRRLPKDIIIKYYSIHNDENKLYGINLPSWFSCK